MTEPCWEPNPRPRPEDEEDDDTDDINDTGVYWYFRPHDDYCVVPSLAYSNC